MKKFKIFSLLLFLLSTKVCAEAVYKTGKVTSVKMFGDVFVIYVDTVDSACTSNNKRVAIKKGDPVYSVTASAAIAAKISGSKVQIGYHDQCTNNSSAWDFESFWLL